MIYTIGQRTTVSTSGGAAHTILTSATLRALLLEAGVFANPPGSTAAACTYGLGRPAANGVTPGTQSLFQAEDMSTGVPASLTNGVLSWTTSPTSPTVAMRRWSGPATAGVGIIWVFPRGILVKVSDNFVLQNLASNTGLADSYFNIDE
jgi:hypothetical protein